MRGRNARKRQKAKAKILRNVRKMGTLGFDWTQWLTLQMAERRVRASLFDCECVCGCDFFCQSYPPPCLPLLVHPLNICPPSTPPLPPPLLPPLLPPLRSSSSLISSPLISLVIIHCVVSFLSSSPKWAVCMFVPFVAPFMKYLYIRQRTRARTRTDTQTGPLFYIYIFPLGSQTPIKASV